MSAATKRPPKAAPGSFFSMIERLRAAALVEFARQLSPQHHASAMCHLAETLMMFAKSRSSTEYVRCWLRKIEAHLDGDDARAVAAIMRADDFAP
ncbi:MAG: hypothetical protein ACREFP_05585, partial [Acetobacteraceae bacterium]